MKHITLLTLSFGLLSGCAPSVSTLPKPPAIEQPVTLGRDYQPDQSGIIRGVVVHNQGPLRNAYVTLKNVDPHRSKPWPDDLLKPLVIVRPDGFHASQSIILLGATMTFVSHHPRPQQIRGRGALVFTMPFAEMHKPSTRVAERTGVIELTSGSMMPDEREFLFVSQHPYVTMTNDFGQFELRDVPAGEYEVSVWKAGETKIGHERDPESGMVSRLRFPPPREVSFKLNVTAKAITEVQFEMP